MMLIATRLSVRRRVLREGTRSKSLSNSNSLGERAEGRGEDEMGIWRAKQRDVKRESQASLDFGVRKRS